MKELEEKLADYQEKTYKIKYKMLSKLWTIFTETTGYSPDDVCLVEQKLDNGLTTLYYFSVKDKHQEERG